MEELIKENVQDLSLSVEKAREKKQEYIKEKILENVNCSTIKEISEKTNISPGIIYYYIKKFNIKIMQKPKNIRIKLADLTDEQKKEIINFLKMNYGILTKANIAKKFNVSVDTLNSIIVENIILKRPKKSHQKLNLLMKKKKK